MLSTLVTTQCAGEPFMTGNGLGWTDQQAPTSVVGATATTGLGGGVQWLSPWLLPAALACLLTVARHRAGCPDFFRFDTSTFWGRTQVSLAVMCLAYLTPLNVSPFVYFQF